MFYATQVGVQPPTIVMFVNNPKAFPHTYKRYLLSVLRDQLEFGEVPIKLYLQTRTQTGGALADDHDASEAARGA